MSTHSSCHDQRWLGNDEPETSATPGLSRGLNRSKIQTACNLGDLGSIPGLGRFPGEGKGYPLQYSGLGNSMDCIVHGVAKSQTQLSNFRFQRADEQAGPE